MDLLTFLNKIFKINRDKVRPNGRCRKYYDNGVGLLHYEYYQKDGVFHGPFKTYSKSGILLESGSYRDGLLDGFNYLFDKDGNRLEEKHYENGVLDGPFKYYSNGGVIQESGFYKNSELDGLHKSFDERGNLLEKKNYENGVLNGPFKYYSNDGVKQESGFYKDSKLDGLHKSFDKQGNLIELKSYENGVLNGPCIRYDSVKNERIKRKNQNYNEELKGTVTNHRSSSEFSSEINNLSGKLHGRYVTNEDGNYNIRYYYKGDILPDSTVRKELTYPVLKFIDRLISLNDKYLKRFRDSELISMSNKKIEEIVSQLEEKDREGLEILLKFKRTFFIILFTTSKDLQLVSLGSKFLYYLNHLMEWFKNMHSVSDEDLFNNNAKVPSARKLFVRTELQNSFISNYFEQDILLQEFNDFNTLELNLKDFKRKQLVYNNPLFGKNLEVYKTIKLKLDYRPYGDDYLATIPIESMYKSILEEIDELIQRKL